VQSSGGEVHRCAFRASSYENPELPGITMLLRGSFTNPWQPVSTAPRNRDVEVQVVDQFGFYALPFPCRLTDTGWVTHTYNHLTLQPTHWRARLHWRDRPHWRDSVTESPTTQAK
jgi:hypothetical protein